MAGGTAGTPSADRRAAVTTAAGVAASLTALLVAAPSPDAAVDAIASAASSTDPAAALVAAVSLLAWALSGWLALTVALVRLARLPGMLGGACRALAGRVAPAAVRRAVEAALGLAVAVGTLTPSAAAAAPVPATATAATPATTAGAPAGGEAAWDLDWPSTSAAPPPEVRRTPATAPVPAPPPTAAPVTTPAAGRPRTAPPAVPPAVGRPAPAPPARAPVVVRPGDSLWSLAEASLRRAGVEPSDRQVAQAWPRWWSANREVVGDDPDLLLPGTVLHPPPGAGPA